MVKVSRNLRRLNQYTSGSGQNVHHQKTSKEIGFYQLLIKALATPPEAYAKKKLFF